MDGTTNDLIGNIPLVLGKRVLNPGQTINVFNECYTPAKPDSDQTDPDLARYSDQVAAIGEGFIGGITQEETAARLATCARRASMCSP